MNYSPEMWQQLSNQLRTNYNVNCTTTYLFQIPSLMPQSLADMKTFYSFKAIRPIDRSSLLDDVFNLASATQLNYSTALSITRYMSSENHYFPWHTARVGLNYIGTMLYGHPEYHLWRVRLLRMELFLIGVSSIYKTFFPPAYVVRREFIYVFTGVCPWGGGGTPRQDRRVLFPILDRTRVPHSPRQGRGYLCPLDRIGGTPASRQDRRYPHLQTGQGYPTLPYPIQDRRYNLTPPSGHDKRYYPHPIPPDWTGEYPQTRPGTDLWTSG